MLSKGCLWKPYSHVNQQLWNNYTKVVHHYWRSHIGIEIPYISLNFKIEQPERTGGNDSLDGPRGWILNCNIKMSSSKLIIKSIVQKVMAKFGLEHRFHDLKCFEILKLESFTFLEFTMNSREIITKICRKISFWWSFIIWIRQLCVQYIYLHTTCTIL